MSAGRTIVSKSRDWGTPPKYVEAVWAFFEGAPELDPCSNEHSIVNAEIELRLPSQDGLSVPWNYKSVFVNPPYGSDRERGTSIRDWLKKCAEADAEVLALVPVATNTKHWKFYVWGAATGVAFLYDTRLRFLVDGADAGKGAPMACAMVYWGSRYLRFGELFLKFGACVDISSLREKAIGSQ